MIAVARWQFTVADYARMSETGILTEDDRVELIDGEVRAMSPIGPLHTSIVKRLNALLGLQLGDTVIVSVQDPVQLDTYSEPEPDLAVLRSQQDFYARRHPQPEDILLLIEVSDSSLAYDREEKIPRYALAGIPEVWIIDVHGETVEQYLEPRTGSYRTIHLRKSGDILTSITLPQLAVDVNYMLGIS